MKKRAFIRTIEKITGVMMLICGFAMLPSIITAFIHRQSEAECLFAFICCAAVCLVVGSIISRSIKLGETNLRLQEGCVIVVLTWLIISLIGSIPYLVSSFTHTFIDAFFESVAGFTTTGCTLSAVELMPKSIMMWKAVSHWLGGMGILVFAISVLPALGVGGQKIVKAETPGPTVDKLSSKISDSARILYATYIGFTAVEFVLLLAGPMDLYESIINTLGNVSTAGLFTHSEGISYYGSFYTEIVMAGAMVLLTLNFTLFSKVFSGHFRDILNDTELRTYLFILLGGGLVSSAALYLCGTYDNISTCLRYGFFQAISFSSTTGYQIDDYTTWPSITICLFIVLMFIGGCASSTAGGIKVIRLSAVLKVIRRNFFKKLHPRAVVPLKINDKIVAPDTVTAIISSVLTFILVFISGAFLLSFQNLDLLSTLEASAAALSNTGAGMGAAVSDFSIFTPFSRVVLSVLMLFGRLELVTVLLLFRPSTWKK